MRKEVEEKVERVLAEGALRLAPLAKEPSRPREGMLVWAIPPWKERGLYVFDGREWIQVVRASY